MIFSTLQMTTQETNPQMKLLKILKVGIIKNSSFVVEKDRKKQ